MMQTSDKQKTIIIIGGVVVVTTALAIAYFGILRPLLQKFNIIDDKDDKTADKLNSEEAFSPQLAKNKPYKVTISEGEANSLAQTIYAAKGYIYDNEDAAIGAVRACGTTYNLSYMAGKFQNIYDRDLLQYMKTFMNSEQLATVYEAIKKFQY